MHALAGYPVYPDFKLASVSARFPKPRLIKNWPQYLKNLFPLITIIILI